MTPRTDALTWPRPMDRAAAVEYSRWAPYYERIAREFGYPFSAEEAAARELGELLDESARSGPETRLRRRLAGRDVLVLGRGGSGAAPPIARLPDHGSAVALIAADGAAEPCLGAGLVPAVIVTDLDGPVPVEVAGNARGALVLLHAHGDNRAALARWVPEFPGELAGSWAGAPGGGLVNFGGFTDGDRAVYLAEAMGARRIYLFGFDFERPAGPGSEPRPVKRAKLRWARYLIAELARSSPVPISFLRPDGSQLAVQLPGTPGAPSGPSIQ
ncbi:MAG: 6-hydroxymethylpterin diphosphokinase MptE-like protein [Thermoplasmata archaeon]